LFFKKAANQLKPYWFEITLLCVIAALTIWKRSFVFSGDGTTSATVLTASIIIYGISFVFAELFLRRQGLGVKDIL